MSKRRKDKVTQSMQIQMWIIPTGSHLSEEKKHSGDHQSHTCWGKRGLERHLRTRKEVTPSKANPPVQGQEVNYAYLP